MTTFLIGTIKSDFYHFKKSAVSIKFRFIKITETTKSNMTKFCYCLDTNVVERLEGRAGDERVSKEFNFL